MSVIAVVLVVAGLVVLVSVAASGLGPALSLRKSLGGVAELTHELDALRRRLERLEHTTARLREHRDGVRDT